MLTDSGRGLAATVVGMLTFGVVVIVLLDVLPFSPWSVVVVVDVASTSCLCEFGVDVNWSFPTSFTNELWGCVAVELFAVAVSSCPQLSLCFATSDSCLTCDDNPPDPDRRMCHLVSL